MSRVYIAVPVDPDHAAEALASVAKAHRESPEEASERGYTGPQRILRLRDRTGPSVAERLVALETEHAALVVRVGELERLPVASEDASPISEAALNGPPEWCCDLVPPTEEPAPVRPEPGSVAEDQDRLAKVAHVASLRAQGMTETLPWSPAERAVCCAIAAAVAEAYAANVSAASAAERDALLARAEKAERELEAAHGHLPPQFREPVQFHVRDVRSLAADWQKRGEELEALRAAAPRRTAEEERADVVAMLDDQEVYARKHERPSADAYLHARVRVANGEHVGAAATRPSAPEPIVHVPTESAGADGARLVPSEAEAPTRSGWSSSYLALNAMKLPALSEAEMAAELYQNEWYKSSAGWARRGAESDGYTHSTKHAHAAMRAAKGAR